MVLSRAYNRLRSHSHILYAIIYLLVIRFQYLLTVMSSSSATPGDATSSGNGTTLPPEITMDIIQAYAVAIRPSITFIVLQTVFTSMLIPILIALFLFSTHQLRRCPIFILNVLSLLLAIGLGIWNNYVEVRCMSIHALNAAD